MRNEGRLVAHDTAPDRLKLIEENCARLGVTCVQTVLPSTLNPQPSTLFDRILVDAPCSNTGVMRRRVDLRWRIRLEEIERLRATQLELLRQAAVAAEAGRHAGLQHVQPGTGGEQRGRGRIPQRARRLQAGTDARAAALCGRRGRDLRGADAAQRLGRRFTPRSRQ